MNKWVYVESRSGLHLAKEYIDPKKAFDILKEKGYLVRMIREMEDWVLYRIY